MKPASSEATVLERLLLWSQDRPTWQRDALRRIVSKGALNKDDLNDLIALCKRGLGCKDTALTPEPLANRHLPKNPGEATSVSLVSISDVAGVNNLATGQTLNFEIKGITIVYGDNGAGKSGYTRILKRACRARHTGKIEANIYGASAAARIGDDYLQHWRRRATASSVERRGSVARRLVWGKCFRQRMCRSPYQ